MYLTTVVLESSTQMPQMSVEVRTKSTNVSWGRRHGFDGILLNLGQPEGWHEEDGRRAALAYLCGEQGGDVVEAVVVVGGNQLQDGKLSPLRHSQINTETKTSGGREGQP